MKKHTLRALMAGGVAAALLCGIVAVTALADGNVPTVTYDHANRQFVFTNFNDDYITDGDGAKYPNLFQAMDGGDGNGLMPGDTVTQEIHVTTSGMGSGSVILTLRAEPTADADANADYEKLLSATGEDEDGDGQPDGVTLTVREKNGATMTDMNGNVVEEISGSLGEGVTLGRLYRGDSLDLVVTLDIPVTVGNELQGLEAQVGWVFTADYRSGGGGTDPDPGPSNSGGGGTDIPEESTPLGPLPDLERGDHFAYIVGRDDGLVHPEAEITRAEVGTIFFRLLTEESRNQFWATTNPYTDVPSDAWFNKAISTLTNAGIIYGRGAGIFDPDASITRAEFAAMAVRFFGGGYEGEDLFSDIDGHWAQDAINQAANQGIVSGYPDGTFRPDNNITRSEAISIINRVLDRRPEKDHLLAEEDMITWPDNMDTSTWYYADIQEATNSHDYDPSEERDEEGNQYEIWTGSLPVRDWITLERAWTNSNESVNPGDVMFVTSRESAVIR